MNEKLNKLLALHAELLLDNDYCYFELARTRTTDWMAWICTDAYEEDPRRKILAKGQGSTPEEACANALSYYNANMTNPF